MSEGSIPRDEPELERCDGPCKICDPYDKLGLGHHPDDGHNPDHLGFKPDDYRGYSGL
jgi:hypothetical protein